MGLSFYKPAKCLSYNAPYNFIVGARGLGKTYAFKVKAVKDAINRGEEFIYLRRYKPEIASAAPAFFSDFAHEFPDYDFRANGKYAQMSPRLKEGEAEKGRKWKNIGYFLALSVAQSYKSVSFSKVTKIIFDEFISENSSVGYLPNEFDLFNNFYSTVDRWQDRTRVYFLANSVSIMNPYFIALEIRPDQQPELFTMRNGFVFCHFPESKKFAAEVFQTKFGQFIQSTEYADYAVGNEFSDGHEELIRAKTAESEYLFTLETVKTGKFSVWHDFKGSQYFVTTHLPKVERVFTLDHNRMTEGKVYVKYNDAVLSKLRTAYNTARVLFDKPSTRNAFAEIMVKRG